MYSIYELPRLTHRAEREGCLVGDTVAHLGHAWTITAIDGTVYSLEREGDTGRRILTVDVAGEQA